MNRILDDVEKRYLKKNIPDFRVGDLVRVDVKVVEGDNERLQAFEGVVIREKGHGLSRTFTVRKVSFGVGVERTFPLHTPRVESIKVIRSGRVRRAKLYYLRELTGKAARIEESESSALPPGAPLPTAEPTTPPAPASPHEASGPLRPAGSTTR